MSFTAAGLTSSYHAYAAGIAADEPGLVVWLHGDDAYEHLHPSETYIMAGTSGIRQACKDRGFVLVSALAPDTTGTVTWWEDGDANAHYLDALVRQMAETYHVKPGRVVLAGHSGGSQQITRHYMPRHADTLAELGGALTMVVGGGGTPITEPSSWSAAAKTGVAMHWAVGELDVAANAGDGFDGVAAATAGEAYYHGKGFTRTSLQTIAGKQHDISPLFGPTLAAQLDRYMP